MDALIISYSEPSRSRERHQFFNETSRTGSGWGRFLHSNYIGFDNDILLPNHLASLAELTKKTSNIAKTSDGLYLYSDINTYSAWKIPMLGGIYLYQYLKSIGFSTSIIQHVQFEQEQLDDYLKQAPKVIGISTTLLLNPLDITELVKYCRKKSPASLIVIGGMSIWNSYLANKHDPNLFKLYRADIAVIDAKGVKTLGAIVSAVVNNNSIDEIPNLIIYKNSAPKVTPQKPETFDFGTDGICWDLVEPNLMGRLSLIRTQISCPFACSFCSYPTSQGTVVKTGLDSFEQELKILHKRGVTYLLFIDDTFNVPPERFKEMLQILKRFAFRWYAFIRCQYLDKQQVIDMRDSGCGGAYLGIESGSNEILTLMNKRARRADYLRGVELLESAEIPTYASFIVGFPGETDNTIMDTISFIEHSGISFYNVKIFYYDHTTPIASKREAFNLTGQGMNWTHRTMNSADAFDYSENIIKTVNQVPYIPQHSGEIWEIAYFHEKGFTNNKLQMLYKTFSLMMQDDLNRSDTREQNQKLLFQQLVDSL